LLRFSYVKKSSAFRLHTIWKYRYKSIALIELIGAFSLYPTTLDQLLTNKRITEETLSATGTPSPYGPVLAGIVLSVSNPYWIIWWVTIGMGFVTQSLQYRLIGLILFYFGHILSDLAWFSFVSFSVSAGQQLCPSLLYRIVFILCGTLLICLGLIFIANVLLH
jgi:threonine/homoserine/homoserine lactone efflux protein